MNNTDIVKNIKTASLDEITYLIGNFSDEDMRAAYLSARQLTDEIFGRKIYIRGLIEFTNICRNDCYYCGLRCSNYKAERYRLSEEEIFDCCKKGYELGFRTFVLQGGEDPYFDDEKMIPIVSKMRKDFTDCAITLSLGERSYESYLHLFEAGADRYLLRHETFNAAHYTRLHPDKMSRNNRLKCLYDLKKIGYQTGCGIMVGSPYQTAGNIAEDLIFIREFKPEMVGIGPFIPQKDTPFGNMPQGSLKLTLFLLSLIRLMLPEVLLPATTALGIKQADGTDAYPEGIGEYPEGTDAHPEEKDNDGRILGLNAGANVIMPNLSPAENRDKYRIYDNKASAGDDALTQFVNIRKLLNDAGYEMEIGRGDSKNYVRKKRP